MSFHPVSVVDIELAKFKASVDARNLYVEGKERLKASGIFSFLRLFARPFTADRGANPYTAAYSAAFSEGYNKCLDDLIYFEEQYLVEALGRKAIQANFGGLSLALAKGDLTQKDINGK